MKRLASIVLALSLALAAGLGCSGKSQSAEVRAEIEAREAFARAAVVDAGAGGALEVGSRSDVRFEDGFSIVSYDPPDDFLHGNAFRWMGQRSHVRVRAHHEHPMHLRIRGWLNEKVIRSKPVVAVYLDGQLLRDTGAVEEGFWVLETDVSGPMLHDLRWLDLVLTISTVAFQWAEPPDLRIAVLNSVQWTELP